MNDTMLNDGVNWKQTKQEMPLEKTNGVEMKKEILLFDVIRNLK